MNDYIDYLRSGKRNTIVSISLDSSSWFNPNYGFDNDYDDNYYYDVEITVDEETSFYEPDYRLVSIFIDEYAFYGNKKIIIFRKTFKALENRYQEYFYIPKKYLKDLEYF